MQENLFLLNIPEKWVTYYKPCIYKSLIVRRSQLNMQSLIPSYGNCKIWKQMINLKKKQIGWKYFLFF